MTTINFNFQAQGIRQAAEQLGMTPVEMVQNDSVLETFELLDADKAPTGNSEDAKYLKRKSESVEVQLPNFIDTLPEDAKEAVTELVKDAYHKYIKVQFINDFQKPDRVNWEDVASYITTTGRAAKYEFTEDQLKQAASLFGDFCAQALGIPAMGPKLQAVAKTKFSKASIQRHTNKFSEEICDKLDNLIDNFVANLAEQSEDTASELEDVFNCWHDALERNKRSMGKDVTLDSIL